MSFDVETLIARWHAEAAALEAAHRAELARILRPRPFKTNITPARPAWLDPIPPPAPRKPERERRRAAQAINASNRGAIPVEGRPPMPERHPDTVPFSIFDDGET